VSSLENQAGHCLPSPQYDFKVLAQTFAQLQPGAKQSASPGILNPRRRRLLVEAFNVTQHKHRPKLGESLIVLPRSLSARLACKLLRIGPSRNLARIESSSVLMSSSSDTIRQDAAAQAHQRFVHRDPHHQV